MSDKSAALTRSWLFFDANCAFCTSWVRLLEPALLRRGFHCTPLQEPWVQPLLGLSHEELLSAVRLWTPDHTQLSGADAIVVLARHIWWARPLFVLSRLPRVMCLLRAAYASLATRRHCLSFATTSTYRDDISIVHVRGVKP